MNAYVLQPNTWSQYCGSFERLKTVGFFFKKIGKVPIACFGPRRKKKKTLLDNDPTEGRSLGGHMERALENLSRLRNKRSMSRSVMFISIHGKK